MEYRIFNVRTSLCVHVHSGVGYTDESAQHFDSEKLTNVSCAPGGIRTSGHGVHWISRPTLYRLSHHVPSGCPESGCIFQVSGQSPQLGVEVCSHSHLKTKLWGTADNLRLKT